jgi:DNA-binding Lrp family transcriptional regulator
MNLSSIDRKLVDLLQAECPLTKHPYADVGLGLGISEEEVITHIKQLKAEGIIRQVGPVFAAGSLGYKTTLVAMRVAEKQLDKVAQLIMKHPGISHGYERDHYFNLWFTLATPATGDIEAELSGLAELIKAEAIFDLPALRLFKLRTYFALGGNGQTEATDNHNTGVREQKAKLSSSDRMVINELQQDLPLTHTPFSAMAVRLGMDEDYFLVRCQSLKQRGIIRRFGAAVNHRKAGFKANAMTCWIAPREKVDAAGRKLALLKEVSHCYERKTNPLWRYNLFAMIHGRTKEACQEIASKVSAETGLTDYVMLFSTREFKKTRVKYLV